MAKKGAVAPECVSTMFQQKESRVDISTLDFPINVFIYFTLIKIIQGVGTVSGIPRAHAEPERILIDNVFKLREIIRIDVLNGSSGIRFR